ncbi:MAG: hypothetical protein V5A62_18670 [Haloarculaceae archaeon]
MARESREGDPKKHDPDERDDEDREAVHRVEYAGHVLPAVSGEKRSAVGDLGQGLCGSVPYHRG